MVIVLTALVTVIVATLSLALGQLVLEGTVKPALELKRLIGSIAYDLDYYGTDPLYEGADAEKEWRARLKDHAIKLRESLNLVLYYSVFERLLQLPLAVEILEASRELQHESLRSASPTEWTQSHADKIKKLLHIKPYYT